MLIVLGGLPGTGKTTIARALAARQGATYLRVDVIEQALRTARGSGGDVGEAGYIVANALAASNLANGGRVVADCVNPVRESREAWRATAAGAGARLIEVEILCCDLEEHRRRVEQRSGDIEGLMLPTWREVQARAYAPWQEPHIVVDTACLTPEAAIAIIERQMEPRS